MSLAIFYLLYTPKTAAPSGTAVLITGLSANSSLLLGGCFICLEINFDRFSRGATFGLLLRMADALSFYLLADIDTNRKGFIVIWPFLVQYFINWRGSVVVLR